MSKDIINPYVPPQPQPDPPPGWRDSLLGDILSYITAHVFGGLHGHAPGETRVHLDHAGLITFYNPILSSLVEARQGKDRLHYRLLERNLPSRPCDNPVVSPPDIEYITRPEKYDTRKLNEGKG